METIQVQVQGDDGGHGSKAELERPEIDLIDPKSEEQSESGIAKQEPDRLQ
ncbi:MAG: hypothetical protein M3Y57_22810 [Acidobacteriota bacterium]|nr:hypothetical protein [Acidobacteriota bacterium]